jgi:hypothetical protein
MDKLKGPLRMSWVTALRRHDGHVLAISLMALLLLGVGCGQLQGIHEVDYRQLPVAGSVPTSDELPIITIRYHVVRVGNQKTVRFPSTIASSPTLRPPRTYAEWAKLFLQYTRLPVCKNNLIALVAWEANEGSRASWNPLDTTLRMPGSTNFNRVGVQNYLSLEQGLQAVALTLNKGATIYRDGAIVAALAACAPPIETAQAVAGSNWCGPICPPTYVTSLIPRVAASFG